MKKAITYYRVSTDRQGRSGLGLEAQQESVRLFVDREGYNVQAEFIEIESGRKNDRPQLLAALKECRQAKAVLIIAKLDRLGRNVAFISNLMESQVEFKAADNPHANRLMLHLLSAFAEHEREQISIRTKDALQAAKRRGVILGKYAKEFRGKQISEDAKGFAVKMSPLFAELQTKGITTIRAIRDELNANNIPTFRPGGKWHNCSVYAIKKRMIDIKNDIIIDIKKNI